MSRTATLAQRPPWLVRVSDSDGHRIAGAGVLIDDRHVLTCAHVVARQTGCADTAPDAPAATVVVELPFTDDTAPLHAELVGWQPVAPDDSGDAALLRLPEPVRVTPAPLACPPRLSGSGFSAHGFPGGARAAREAKGHLGGSSGPSGEWIQLEAGGDTGWAVEHGFSGAPVFHHGSAAVVGIVVMRDQHRSGHMLPISYLRTLWREVDDNIRWRLDLDPVFRTHWLPRARGSEVESDHGEWYFTGRIEARRAICAWLQDTAPEHPIMVVTGGPGIGKSALLSHLLVAADPLHASEVPTGGPRPPRSVFDLALHLKGMTRDEVIDRLAAAANVTATTHHELVAAIREARSHRPLIVLADAVEEAASVEEARSIAELLRSLARAGVARILAAVRTAPAETQRGRLLDTFGQRTPRIDLEASPYLQRRDITDYVHRLLTSEKAGSDRYRSCSQGEIRTIAAAVARRARDNFLIAQLTSRWLTHPGTSPPDLRDPSWESTLPETIGEAMDAYIDTCGADSGLVRRVLTALAFARGNGLPRDRTWLEMADALHPGHSHRIDELNEVFASAANYLVERTGTGNEPTYRLYHDALDQHLRDQCANRSPESSIVDALLSTARTDSGTRDWTRATDYARAHLAGHAAAAGCLDKFLVDADYLIHAEPGPLLAVVNHACGERARLAAAIYRRSSQHHRHADPALRCRILSLDAARLGDHALQEDLDTAYDPINPAGESDLGWRISFATGGKASMANVGALPGHDGAVTGGAVTDLDGGSVAVTTGADGTARLWDLDEQRQIGQLNGHTGPVAAVAVADLDGQWTAITAGTDDTIRVWDLSQRIQIGELDVVGGPITRLAVAQADGRPLVITSGEDSSAHVWDLAEQALIGTLDGHRGPIGAIAIADLYGESIAITSGADRTLRVWNPGQLCEIGRLAVPPEQTGEVRHMAAGTWEDRTILVTSSDDEQALRIWDLSISDQLSTPVHFGVDVESVALTSPGGRPVVVASGADRRVRTCDLVEQEQAEIPLTGSFGTVRIVAAFARDARPLAVVSSDDGTVQVLDLAEHSEIGNPLAGHAAKVHDATAATLGERSLAISRSLDATLEVWDLAERCSVSRLTGPDHEKFSAPALVSEDHPICIAITAQGRIQAWDLLRQGEVGPAFGHVADADCIAAMNVHNDVKIVTGHRDRSARVWSLARHQQIGAVLSGHDGPVRNVRLFERNGLPAAVTHDEHSVLTWDLGTHHRLGPPLGDLPGTVHSVAAVGDGDRVLGAISFASMDQVQVWDLTAGSVIGGCVGHAAAVTSVAATAISGRPVAFSAAGDRSLLVWDMRTCELVDQLWVPTEVGTLAACASGAVVATIAHDIAVFEPRDAFGLAALPRPPHEPFLPTTSPPGLREKRAAQRPRRGLMARLFDF